MDISRPEDDLFQEGLFAMWKPFEAYQPDHDPLAIYFTCMIRNYLTDMLTGKHPPKKSSDTDGSYRHSAIPAECMPLLRTDFTHRNVYI
ncbi:sigma factor [Virgibacillus siamensis]|uniref:sigma factor n=1 Tax=Virgibacillus siamensis TaxID=480071 RepID=UPI0031D6341D